MLTIWTLNKKLDGFNLLTHKKKKKDIDAINISYIRRYSLKNIYNHKKFNKDESKTENKMPREKRDKKSTWREGTTYGRMESRANAVEVNISNA